MMKKLSKKDFLTDQDLTAAETNLVLDLAKELKEKQKKGVPHKLLEGKSLVLIFQKPSTRTWVSFETGMYQLGGNSIFLTEEHSQIARGESIADTARTLSRYVDGIMARVYEQSFLEEMAKHATVPVINGLSNDLHPCQILSDLLTIQEKKGKLQGLNIAYLSDANNVSNSLMLACTKMGMNVTIFTPKEFPVNEWAYNEAMNNCHTSRGMIQIKNKLDDSISDMDILYADKWISMHQHVDEKKIRKLCLPFQINEKMIENCKEDVIVMHDLPALHGDEITEGVFEGHHSVVFDQAENRLHAQKALLALLL